MKLLRKGQTITKEIKPRVEMLKDESGISKQVHRIGIGPARHIGLYSFDFVSALGNSVEELTFITVTTYKSILKLITGSSDAKDSVAGPIGIFYIVKGAAEEGLSHVLYILGVISASLAIFNLLPVIPLDGGHLFFLGIERIRGKALPAKADEYIAKVGFGLIILLAIFVFYSDFSRFGWIDKIKALFS